MPNTQPQIQTRPQTRWMTLLCSLLLIGLAATDARAGNIFDDNWAPATPRRPASAPSTTSTTEPKLPSDPATPPVPSQTAAIRPAPTLPAAHVRRPVPTAVELARSRKLFKEVFA